MNPAQPPAPPDLARLPALEEEIALLTRVAQRQAPVLVADDMQSMRLLLAQAVKTAGFSQVLRAADGLAALKLMEAEPCGLALVDWNMPRLDGLELLGRVRAHPRLKHMVYLLVTAESLDVKVMQAAEENQDGFVSKPVSAEKLGRRLELVLERRLTVARAARWEARGQAERAAEELLGAMANQPRLRWPLMALGGLMARQGRWEEAERCFRRALVVDPGALGALVEMGRLYDARGRGEEARRLHRQAMARNPLFFRAYDALAASLKAEGRMQEALETLLAALERKGSGNAARQEEAGRLAYGLGRHDQAEAALAKALELRPQEPAPELHLLLARARLAQGKHQGALPELQRAAELAGEQGDLRCRLDALLLTGAAHLHHGRPELAQGVFAEIARPDSWPGSRLPFALAHLERELGGIYLRAGLVDQAVARLAASLGLAPGDEANEEAMQRLCAEAGRPELFDQARRACLSWRAEEVAACSRRGLELVGQGRLREAMAHYLRGLELDPGSGRLRFNLGKLLCRLGRAEEGLREAAQAARLGAAEGDWELVAMAARLLAEMGQAGTARQMLRLALAQAPQDQGLGQALEELVEA